MKSSRAWVELALKTLSCNQKELARRVAVSQTQITKWKSGEHMSLEMEENFRKILKLGEKHPEFVLWAGSLEDAEKWDKLIHFLAEHSELSSETGYHTDPLQDDLGLLCVQIADTLGHMGVESPKAFPSELDPYFRDGEFRDDDSSSDDEDEGGELWDLLEENPYTAVIRNIFDSLNDVWGFYVAYVQRLADDDEGELYEKVDEIESSLMNLAAAKIAVDDEFAPEFSTFRYRIIKEFTKSLSALKEAAFRAGTPLRAELLDMVGSDARELGHTAEAEALGFNANRLHPDIYMNELLVGMRVIHQVLPIILKKLDIEFELDESDLRINL
jgi:hypothetical protein